MSSSRFPPSSGPGAAPSADAAPTPLPRLQSSPDLDAMTTTKFSEVAEDLGRLADRTSVPVVTAAVDVEVSLTAEEAFILSLVGTGLSVDALIKRSPLSEDDTLQFLIRLVTLGLVEVPLRAR